MYVFRSWVCTLSASTRDHGEVWFGLKPAGEIGSGMLGREEWTV